MWDTGAQEGLAGKRQLDRWSKLLAEHVLQVEWSWEKPESASGIGGVTKPIGIVFVPVGLAGCNGIIRFTVVEQDDLLPVGIMRTLRAKLDLIDGRDKVIFRQFGEESSLRTVQSGHTTIRADLFDPDCWLLPEITELCPDNDEGFTTNYMSVIAHVHQKIRGMDDDTPAGNHATASTHGCRPQQKTTPSVDGPTRFQTTNQPTTLLLSKSGEPMHGVFQNHERDIWTSSPCDQPRGDSTTWNTIGGQTAETPRPPHGVRAMRGILRHLVSGISDACLHGTIRGTGATRDAEQEEQCCEFSGGPMGARQSLTERQPVNTVEEGAERLRSSTDCDPEGRQPCDVKRTMRDLWEPWWNGIQRRR